MGIFTEITVLSRFSWYKQSLLPSERVVTKRRRMTTTTGWSPASGRAKKERQKFSKEVLTLLKILVDIHSVLNNKHVQLSIVYMRNLLTSTCTLLESYQYISDKRVALSSRVVTHRYKWLVWPVCRFLLSMNDRFQDGQITPPQSYDQLGLDERRWE